MDVIDGTPCADRYPCDGRLMMNSLLPANDLAQQLMLLTLEKKAIALPFAKDIFLLETHVAGLSYYEINSLNEPLTITEPLLLRREPDNPHDSLAIIVLTRTGQKLGYVPRHRNPVLARLMDAGKTLVAEVASLQVADAALSGKAIAEVRFNISLRE